MAEATLVERTSATTASSRAFLRAADTIVQRTVSPPDSMPESAADLIARARAALREAADPGTQRELGRSWSSLDHLDPLSAPTATDLEDAATSRLGGLSPAAFVAARRSQAREAMRNAQHHRIAARTPEAIQGVYESDLAVLEAALVESAVAVDDRLLLSVTIRWELAARAISTIPGLPDSVVGAAERIRSSIVEALGPGDGARVASAFLSLS